MRASLVAIGCDKYHSGLLNDLKGAENDASSIYEVLVHSEYSIYEKDGSYILKSPDMATVRRTLEEVLFDKQCPDIFTFFFAGHGGISNGTYYLCLSDTKLDRMSFTGLSLTDIFRIVSSSNVRHINLIIDACNTGGLVYDLPTLLKPDLIGAKGSFGVSILAAAALDEFAVEIAGKGLLTASLVNLLSGTEKTNTDVEFLDLVNLGRIVSTKFIQENQNQTPTSWGINLYGPSIFARNPFYSHGKAISTYDISFIPPASKVGMLLLNYKDQLWTLYDDIDNVEGVEGFLDVIRTAGNSTENIDDLIKLLTGVGYRFIEKFNLKCNVKQLEIINALTTVLMPHLSDIKAFSVVSEFTSLFKQYGTILLDDVINQIQQDKFFLINKTGAGFDIYANHYFLPIRLAKLLGYFSQLLLIDESSLDNFSKFLDLIREHYGHYVIAISEEQAPYLHSFFSVCHELNKGTLAKDFLISYISDYINFSGQIAPLKSSPEKKLAFILQRYTQEKVNTEYKTSVDSLGSSFLLHSVAYDINDEVDSVLHFLDRHKFHLFIPFDIHEFGERHIENGTNLILQCGSNFWTCTEFEQIVSEETGKCAQMDFSSLGTVEKFSCIASSFIQPDRIPFFV
jgi:Caspase domain